MKTPTLDRAGGPRLLILDDEPVQRMTVHLHLAGLGEFVDFGDPRPALEYLAANEVDAVVVDMRMPSLPVDGRWFLEQLRKRDRDLGVVLRTADDSVEIAQAGIESRAVQRVVKSMPDARVRLRSAVECAVQETRERRRAQAALKDASTNRDRLVSVLGRLECEITVAEMCRGFVQGLTNHVAAVAGYAELFLEEAEGRDDATRELLRRNHAAAQALSDHVNRFLATPFFEPNARTTINGCIDALTQICRTHALFGATGCRFEAKGILPDVSFSANPTRLLSALRHLVEFCALRSQPGATILVTVSRCANAQAQVTGNRHGLVLNPRSAPAAPATVLSVQAEVAVQSLEELRDAFRACPADPQCGNLMVLGAELIDDHLALDIVRTRKAATVFSLYLPVAT